MADAREHVRDRAGLAVVERCVRAIETEVAHTSSSDCEISFSEPAIYEIDGGNLFTGNCDTIRPAQLVPNWLESAVFDRATSRIEEACTRGFAPTGTRVKVRANLRH